MTNVNFARKVRFCALRCESVQSDIRADCESHKRMKWVERSDNSRDLPFVLETIPWTGS